MKKKSLLAVVFFLSALVAFGEELIYARPKTNGLDIELSQVHLIAATFDAECIAYRFEMTPSQGTLYVFIPKTMLLENCSIRVNRADIRLEGVQAVHILAMLNMGSVTTTECVFKNAVINIARGSLSCDKTEIVRSCAFTVTDATAAITFPSEEAEYHIDYVQNRGTLTIAGNELTKSPGEYGNAKAKRRIIFSGGAAKTSINFTEKDTKTAASKQHSGN